MSILVWEHSDPRGLARAVTEAAARARAHAWERDSVPMSTGTRAADLRALIAASWLTAEGYQRAHFGRTPTPQGGDIELHPGAYSSPERRTATASLLRTWAQLVPQNAAGPAAFRTSGGGHVEPLTEDAGLPWVAITIAVAVTAVAIAALYTGRDAAEVVDRQLARSETTRRLVAHQAAAVEVAARHLEQERIAGHDLPFNDAEKQILAGLQQAQEAAAKPETPLPARPSPFAEIGSVALVLAALFLFSR